MDGELDFEAALRARVALLAGLDADAIERARARVRLTPGARTFVRTLRRHGLPRRHRVGRLHPLHRLARATSCSSTTPTPTSSTIVDGRLTGELVGPVVDRVRKAELLAHVAELEGIPLDQTVAVGDGANDLDMLAAAGLGIAFNAKPVVREAADTALNVPYLDAVLFVLGVRRSEVEAADAADDALGRADVISG